MVNATPSPRLAWQETDCGVRFGCVVCQAAKLEGSFAKFNVKALHKQHCKRHQETSCHRQAVDAVFQKTGAGDVAAGVPTFAELKGVVQCGRPCADEARRSKNEAMR